MEQAQSNETISAEARSADAHRAAAAGLARWHELLENQQLDGLAELIADEAVFHSPVVHTPQRGKDLVLMYLTGAFHVLLPGNFVYRREVVDGSEVVLEFEAELDGIHVNGVDMIRFNEDGKIIDFKVLVRPLKAINMLHRMMGEMLAKA